MTVAKNSPGSSVDTTTLTSAVLGGERRGDRCAAIQNGQTACDERWVKPERGHRIGNDQSVEYRAFHYFGTTGEQAVRGGGVYLQRAGIPTRVPRAQQRAAGADQVLSLIHI